MEAKLDILRRVTNVARYQLNNPAKRSARQNLLDVVKYAKSAGCTDIEIHAASNCEKVFTGYGHHEDDM